MKAPAEAAPCFIHAPSDVPVPELMALGEQLIAAGEQREIHFCYTCQWCGTRCVIAEPDTIYESGSCSECGGQTQITCGRILLVEPRTKRSRKATQQAH